MFLLDHDCMPEAELIFSHQDTIFGISATVGPTIRLSL